MKLLSVMTRSRIARARAAVVAVLLGAALVVIGLFIVTPRRYSIASLVASAAETNIRVVEGRLHGFDYTPRQVSRSGEEDSLPLLRLRSIAAETAAARKSSTRDEDIHALGIAEILHGRPADAVRSLTELTRRTPANASAWNDLSVAKLELARQTNDVSMLADGLAAMALS